MKYKFGAGFENDRGFARKNPSNALRTEVPDAFGGSF